MNTITAVKKRLYSVSTVSDSQTTMGTIDTVVSKEIRRDSSSNDNVMLRVGLILYNLAIIKVRYYIP